MPFSVKPPVVKEFVLDEIDILFETEGEPTKVTIRQARTGDQNAREDLFAEFKRSYESDGTMQVTQRISFTDVRCKEAFLTMAACNIEGADGKQLFRFNAQGRPVSEKEFKAAWNDLDPAVVTAIYEKVIEMNPQWSMEVKESGEGPLAES